MGQTINVAGSANNDGTYTIAAISSDGLTLTLSQGETLTNGTDLAGVASVTGPDTLTRSSGSFINDGFTPGQVITVTNTSHNNGTYVVGSVTGGTLTLESTTGELTGDPTLTFTPGTNGGGTITRSDLADGGSWYQDGFEAGQTITIQGSASNDGTYTIASISPDGSTLTVTRTAC